MRLPLQKIELQPDEVLQLRVECDERGRETLFTRLTVGQVHHAWAITGELLASAVVGPDELFFWTFIEARQKIDHALAAGRDAVGPGRTT